MANSDERPDGAIDCMLCSGTGWLRYGACPRCGTRGYIVPADWHPFPAKPPKNAWKQGEDDRLDWERTNERTTR